ncbi:uncharacterized protein ARMOST_02626 [Armillaria ostoyae]|uniref:Uncharacterized protein n=1 Tax=Armillaria ostoyae TaxID=47428 RepID=A0A284QSF0_ARMOS|nr:uncharacterized protein ARMOST_02626 [Armillaria ostoyae]
MEGILSLVAEDHLRNGAIRYGGLFTPGLLKILTSKNGLSAEWSITKYNDHCAIVKTSLS